MIKVTMSKPKRRKLAFPLLVYPSAHRTPLFRGNCVHAVDDKGRISLPSEFRRVLGDSEKRGVVLTNYISEGPAVLKASPLMLGRALRRA